ncbi:EF-hand domain-containing protein [Akkermansia glycaniphila]|uniref:Ef hand n=1 Tax=Akkermansia glycaniphila TaxID=1679444 RepID=A0A1C7PEZ7_9BACT|nr:EF-hand domain-containing protein [Akkermansia glycaniphila]OCA04008.1 hypothetical protein AC781_01800 [Akkermansia glycaniphila]SEH72119.1 ef hand [Akkermansia glycaniphila]
MSIRILPAIILCTPFLASAEADNGAPPPAPSPENTCRPNCTPVRKKQAQRMEHIALSLFMRQLILDKYDTDGDGILNDDERKTLLADADKVRDEARRRFISQFDRNKDGKLDAQEQAELKKALSHQHKRHQRRGQPHPGGPPPPPNSSGRNEPPPPPALYILAQKLLLEKFDANRNGKLEPEEFTIIRQEADKLLQAHRATLLKRFDTDQNGSLDKTETENARRTLIQERELHREIDTSAKQPDEIDLFLDARYDMDILLSLNTAAALKKPIRLQVIDISFRG